MKIFLIQKKKLFLAIIKVCEMTWMWWGDPSPLLPLPGVSRSVWSLGVTKEVPDLHACCQCFCTWAATSLCRTRAYKRRLQRWQRVWRARQMRSSWSPCFVLPRAEEAEGRPHGGLQLPCLRRICCPFSVASLIWTFLHTLCYSCKIMVTEHPFFWSLEWKLFL